MTDRVPPQIWEVAWKQFENDHKERLFFTALSRPVFLSLLRTIGNFDVKIVAQVRHTVNSPAETYQLDIDHPSLYTEAVELKVFADRRNSNQVPLKERVQAEWGGNVFRGTIYDTDATGK